MENKKLKLIYNPFSGDRTFSSHLDEVTTIFQDVGYEVSLLRSTKRGDIEENISQIPKGAFDAVVVAGGDGTINLVLNALIKNGHDNIPLGIIPSGTANDFASFMKMPKDIKKAAEIIAKGNIIDTDIGLANDRYFINVCGAGLLTNISQNIDNDIKNLLGKLAYYIKGIGQLPNFVPLNVRITNSEEILEQEIYFFIVINSAGTGGFANLSPSASINDGKLDFIGFKSMPIIDMAKVFLKIFSGEYLNDPNIIYFQDNYFKIEPLFDKEEFLETDVDGEQGPNLPVEIKTLHNKMKLFINKE